MILTHASNFNRLPVPQFGTSTDLLHLWAHWVRVFVSERLSSMKNKPTCSTLFSHRFLRRNTNKNQQLHHYLFYLRSQCTLFAKDFPFPSILRYYIPVPNYHRWSLRNYRSDQIEQHVSWLPTTDFNDSPVLTLVLVASAWTTTHFSSLSIFKATTTITTSPRSIFQLTSYGTTNDWLPTNRFQQFQRCWHQHWLLLLDIPPLFPSTSPSFPFSKQRRQQHHLIVPFIFIKLKHRLGASVSINTNFRESSAWVLCPWSPRACIFFNMPKARWHFRILFWLFTHEVLNRARRVIESLMFLDCSFTF